MTDWQHLYFAFIFLQWEEVESHCQCYIQSMVWISKTLMLAGMCCLQIIICTFTVTLIKKPQKKDLNQFSGCI